MFPGKSRESLAWRPARWHHRDWSSASEGWEGRLKYPLNAALGVLKLDENGQSYTMEINCGDRRASYDLSCHELAADVDTSG